VSNSSFWVDSNAWLTVAENGAPSFTGVSYQTSAQALPIPIIWGTRRVSPQIIWVASLVDFSPGDHGSIFNPSPPGYNAGTDGVDFIIGPFMGQLGAGTGFQGSADLSSSNSEWFVPVIMSIGEGPITDIPRFWNGGGSAAMTWLEGSTWPASPPGTGQPGSVGYDKTYNGLSTQNPWAWWTVDASILLDYPGQNLAYRFTALIVAPWANWGHTRVAPQQSFEVVRTPNFAARLADSYGIAFDYAADAIIVDLLTSVQYGMGLVSGDIDSTSLAAYTNYCFAQGFFLSPLLDSQVAGTDILNRIAVETNTWILHDGIVIRFVPLGDESLTANGFTYTPDTAVAYDLSNNDFLASGPLVVDRADPIDCNNRVRFEFPDRRPGTDNAGSPPASTPGVDYGTSVVEWKDDGLIGQFGLRDASNFTAADICDVAVAAIAVELYGKRLAYVRNTFTFSLSIRFIRIVPGTILTLNEPNIGLSVFPVRVRTIEEDGNGNLAVVAEEYTGALGISRPTVGQPWLPNGVGGGGSGGGGTGVGGGSGTPISTSGGTLTLTSGVPTILVLFVAGDVITLPAVLTAGVQLKFKHDQQRSPQPTPPILEDNPVHFLRPSGATWGIEDPQDGTLAPAAAVTGRGPDGQTITFVFDGGSPGILRCIQ
jgi:hypothetical protein